MKIKRYIARKMRMIAQWMDPQKEGIIGYAIKEVDFVPYMRMEALRELQANDAIQEAYDCKARMRNLAETIAMARIEDILRIEGVIKVQHNLGTNDTDYHGVKCRPEGATIILEVKGN